MRDVIVVRDNVAEGAAETLYIDVYDSSTTGRAGLHAVPSGLSSPCSPAPSPMTARAARSSSVSLLSSFRSLSAAGRPSSSMSGSPAGLRLSFTVEWSTAPGTAQTDGSTPDYEPASRGSADRRLGVPHPVPATSTASSALRLSLVPDPCCRWAGEGSRSPVPWFDPEPVRLVPRCVGTATSPLERRAYPSSGFVVQGHAWPPALTGLAVGICDVAQSILPAGGVAGPSLVFADPHIFWSYLGCGNPVLQGSYSSRCSASMLLHGHQLSCNRLLRGNL